MFLLDSGEPHQAGSHLRAVTQGHWPPLVTQQHKLLLLPSLIQEVPAMVSSFVEHNTEISEMEHCKQQFQHALERLNILLALWETIIQKMDILSKGKEIVPLLAKVVLICTVSSPLVTLNYRLVQPQYCALEWFVLPWSSVTIAHLLRTQQLSQSHRAAVCTEHALLRWQCSSGTHSCLPAGWINSMWMPVAKTGETWPFPGDATIHLWVFSKPIKTPCFD